MGIIVFLVLGGIAGWIASMVMGTDGRQGIVENVIVGVIGALLGGVVVNMVGGTGVTGFNLYSILIATLGSILFIWILRLARSS